jgi:hypothetical protein
MAELNSILLEATVVVAPYLYDEGCACFVIENPMVTIEVRVLGTLVRDCLAGVNPGDKVRVIGKLHSENTRKFILADHIEKVKEFK